MISTSRKQKENDFKWHRALRSLAGLALISVLAGCSASHTERSRHSTSAPFSPVSLPAAFGIPRQPVLSADALTVVFLEVIESDPGAATQAAILRIFRKEGDRFVEQISYSGYGETQPDGNIVPSLSGDGNIVAWQGIGGATHTWAWSMEGNPRTVYGTHPQLSYYGYHVAVKSSAGINLIDVFTGENLGTMSTAAPVERFALSGDAEHLVTADPYNGIQVHVLEQSHKYPPSFRPVATKQITIHGQADPTSSRLATSIDGSVVAYVDDDSHQVVSWHPDTDETSQHGTASPRPSLTATFFADILAFHATDGGIALSPESSQAPCRPVAQNIAHSPSIAADGHIVAVVAADGQRVVLVPSCL